MSSNAMLGDWHQSLSSKQPLQRPASYMNLAASFLPVNLINVIYIVIMLGSYLLIYLSHIY